MRFFETRLNQFLFILSFFVLNMAYLFWDAPKVMYPNTAFIYFLMLLINAWKREEDEDEKSLKDAEAVEKSLLESLPQQRLMKELNMAQRVQQGLLSVESPEIPGIRIAKKCIPAASVGGDFYTFVHNEFQIMAPKQRRPGVLEYVDRRDTFLGIAIGDVAGHGVSSALVMALSSGLLSEIGRNTRSPAKTFERANQDIRKYIENSHITHVTVFYGVVNIDTMAMTYAKAGHPATIIVRKDLTVLELEAAGVFLGMFEDEQYEEKEVQLKPGDRVYFYTDGFTEMRAPNGEMYGIDRFKEFLIKHHDKPVGEVLNMTFDEVERFAQYQSAKDDRSLVILEVLE